MGRIENIPEQEHKNRQFAKLLKPIMEYIAIINKEMKREKDNYLNSVYYLDNYCKEKE